MSPFTKDTKDTKNKKKKKRPKKGSASSIPLLISKKLLPKEGKEDYKGDLGKQKKKKQKF